MSSKEIEKALYHFFGQYDIQINPTKKETFKYKTKVDTKNKKTLKKLNETCQKTIKDNIKRK